ncbi:BRCT domain-containing protein [Aspergillus karnatakaensis]|uniref:BRCT domain protein n=1 Tax=Aspergillus karnatakaensis TaxID=1810916 RepID=UPI003CCE177B
MKHGRECCLKEQPLVGVVLCFTSILPEQRTELASIASQMGAGHSYDLTSDVTHLLVGETNTPKYKFVARERPDVVVLQPEWVEAVRQSWMQGGDTNIQALEEKHRLPTFIGTAICITGFEDMSLRNYIRTNAGLHGAEFRGDLTKTVTHLIAKSAEGDKYKFATQWNVKVVTLKWFTDSIERGMVLEETLYHPLLPPEQQGAGAWNRTVPVVKAKPAEVENSANPRPRKLRRIASAKLGDQNENIWGDIVGMGFEAAEPRPPREDRRLSSEKKSKDAPTIQIAKSFASETTFAAPSQAREPTAEPSVDRRNGFLEDCTTVLRNHLSYNGARFVDSMSEFSRPDIPKTGYGLYIIVPYQTPRNIIPSTDDLAFECEIVTDMWLERCLDAKSLVTPESHIANTPIPSFPVKGLSGMRICSTGFSRIDLLHLSKLVKLVGATYDEYLKPTASVLICNDSVALNHEKLRHAQEWGVPVVGAEWLWSSIRREKRQLFDQYNIRKQPIQSSKDVEERASSRPEPRRHSGQISKDITRQQDPGASHGSETPDIGAASSRVAKRTISESPQKELAPDPKPYSPESQLEESTSMSKPPLDNILKPSSAKRNHSAEPTAATTKSAIDLAVGGLLKQARAAASRSNSDTNGEYDRRSRRPKPLLGRAQSNSSARTADRKAFSRASSIDTLNDDGCGSAVESVNPDIGIPSLGNSGRFDFEYPERDRGIDRAEDETLPPMTQLDYEDPDAVAMREKFLRYAGKIVDKPSKSQDLVLGEVKDLEQVGWGAGRRTRNANKPIMVDDDDDF